MECRCGAVEELVRMELKVLNGSRVLITGHTGFKGFWLSRVLRSFGTEVHGISLTPELGSLFDRAKCGDFSSSSFLDITQQKDLLPLMKRINPDAIIHMAAQPLVLRSYREPILTFNTNVIGTANVLESMRTLGNVRGAIVITSDKVYKNLESGKAYKENDELGGKDPYSASKSACEMVVSAWSNLMSLDSDKTVISARAGNIIGGGDHSHDRILPHLIRSFKLGTPAVLRNPNAVRPWQHVLDPLMGYVTLLSKILNNAEISSSYNFGPFEDSRLKVGELADLACQEWGNTKGWISQANHNLFPEANLLWLDSTKANSELGWFPKLNAREAISWTIDWEKKSLDSDVLNVVDKQIEEYMELDL